MKHAPTRIDVIIDHYYFNYRKTKTYVWNIEDLDNPVLTHTYRSSEDSIDHNMYLIGDTVSALKF